MVIEIIEISPKSGIPIYNPESRTRLEEKQEEVEQLTLKRFEHPLEYQIQI